MHGHGRTALLQLLLRRHLADSGLTDPFAAGCCRCFCVFVCVQSEVEETLERIKAHKGVEGVIIGE